MKILRFTPYLLATSIAVVSGAQAADVRINGFASVGAGKTLSEGVSRNHLIIDPINGGVEQKATYTADPVTEGIYDDEISFKPDSNYGLQISADLGGGLAVTGQITGNGGENFDANVSWAYITYEFNDNWSVMGGRQRLPLFYYSDFIDVGYAYHWIRPPQELAASSGDTLEGVKLRWQGSSDNWDFNTDVYYGGGSEDVAGITIDSSNQYGIVAKVSNDWLILRGTWSYAESVINNSSALQFNQGTKDNPLEYTFFGLAAHMTFDNIFVVSEYTQGSPNDPVFPAFEIGGSDTATGWYVSSGIRLGDFTPHLTYAEGSTDYEATNLASMPTEFERKVETVTAGVRWDFHPSAAFKFEYLTRSDKSDDYYQNSAGGYGYGDPGKVDLISVAVDVIF